MATSAGKFWPWWLNVGDTFMINLQDYEAKTFKYFLSKNISLHIFESISAINMKRSTKKSTKKSFGCIQGHETLFTEGHADISKSFRII